MRFWRCRCGTFNGVTIARCLMCDVQRVCGVVERQDPRKQKLLDEKREMYFGQVEDGPDGQQKDKSLING